MDTTASPFNCTRCGRRPRCVARGSVEGAALPGHAAAGEAQAGQAMTLVPIDGGDERRVSAVEILEHALEEAKRGEIVSVMLVLGREDGMLSSRWSGFKGLCERLGRLRVLEAELLEERQ